MRLGTIKMQNLYRYNNLLPTDKPVHKDELTMRIGKSHQSKYVTHHAKRRTNHVDSAARRSGHEHPHRLI